MTTLTPLSDLRVEDHHVPAHDFFPNSTATSQPLLIYRRAFTNASAEGISAHLRSVGVVQPEWTHTVYEIDHFHSTTHEVLAVTRGAAQLCFGGKLNRKRVDVALWPGDVAIVPAGMAHGLLRDFGSDGFFEVLGSYPVGAQKWDMCYGTDRQTNKVEGIKKLGWFERDPLYGDQGPVLAKW